MTDPVSFDRLENPDTIGRFIEHTQFPAKKRDCTDAYDFGGPDTVGLHVKRVGTKLTVSAEEDPNNSFGRYLGEHPYGFAVLVTKLNNAPAAIELFDTLEDLKTQWRLD
jgi:hypothetical protein